MKLLLDECVPRRLKDGFVDHDISTVREAGFAGLKNGKLLSAASERDFEVLITVDSNIEYQQNKDRIPIPIPIPIGIIVLSTFDNRYESLSVLVPRCLELLLEIQRGQIITIDGKKR